MAKTPLTGLGAILLYANHGSAITATADGSEKTDARLASWKSGFLIAAFGATDVASADETYEIILQGRETSGGAYVDLAQIAFTAAGGAVVNTVKLANVDLFKKRLRARMVLAGTTPSLVVTVMAVCTELLYAPDAGTVITA